MDDHKYERLEKKLDGMNTIITGIGAVVSGPYLQAWGEKCFLNIEKSSVLQNQTFLNQILEMYNVLGVIIGSNGGRVLPLTGIALILLGLYKGSK